MTEVILVALYCGCMVGIAGILLHTMWETHKLEREVDASEEEKDNG
tara:strand:+ start:1471 stop:1608 length:138 start_codon:yes stop_codon:yes gene_type:complete